MDFFRPDHWNVNWEDDTVLALDGKEYTFEKGKRYLMEINYVSTNDEKQSFQPQLVCEPVEYDGYGKFVSKICTPGIVNIHRVISVIGD